MYCKLGVGAVRAVRTGPDRGPKGLRSKRAGLDRTVIKNGSVRTGPDRAQKGSDRTVIFTDRAHSYCKHADAAPGLHTD
jgi:hypothetical protein